MTDALLVFSRMVAWSVLFLASFAIVVNTYARWAETPVDAFRMEVEGEHWRSRVPFVVAIVVASMWLYASWGASP